MKTVLKIVGGLLLLLVVAVGGLFGWAKLKDRSLFARTIAVHDVDFPIPFPLTEEEAAEAQQAADHELSAAELDSIALDRARARGQHLVESRYGCTECHGKSFGGGTMVDAPPIGRILGPNLTLGQGSRTLSYTARDWDHMVRHGIKPDGHPGAMPAQDFQNMSDEELSDIVVFIRSHPPVDSLVPPPALGPVGTVLVAVGKIPLAADVIPDHERPHAARPPASEVSVEFGRHLASVCAGCHNPKFSGGPVPGGDPSWPAAANLTDPAGVGSWNYDQFVTTLREGKRPDGTELRTPMREMASYAGNMSDTELQALWAYIHSLPATPTGG